MSCDEKSCKLCQTSIRFCLGSYKGTDECVACPQRFLCKDMAQGITETIMRKGKHVKETGKYKGIGSWKRKDKY